MTRTTMCHIGAKTPRSQISVEQLLGENKQHMYQKNDIRTYMEHGIILTIT